MKVNQKDYNNNASVIHFKSDKEFRKEGLSEEEIKILRNETDPRKYAFELGYIRCTEGKDDITLEMNEFDANVVRKLDKKFYNIELPTGYYRNIPKEDLGNIWKYRL